MRNACRHWPTAEYLHFMLALVQPCSLNVNVICITRTCQKNTLLEHPARGTLRCGPSWPVSVTLCGSHCDVQETDMGVGGERTLMK